MKAQNTKNLRHRQEELLDLLRHNDALTLGDLMSRMGLDRQRVRMILWTLTDRNLVCGQWHDNQYLYTLYKTTE